MAAYIYANIEITDPAIYEEYRKVVPALIASHGGRYLVRGGAVTVLEGDPKAQRQVILEFPDMAHARAFYFSHEYQVMVKLRQSGSTGSLILIEGVPA
jgi:uncharacterized protein (DUF1330 family)